MTEEPDAPKVRAEMADAIDPAELLHALREAVDGRLEAFFEEERARVRALAAEPLELVDEIARLSMRGGKRVRPAMLVAGFLATDPEARPERALERALPRCLDACAALELLQSYLLIHDDWMDGDLERRGGPSVHAALRRAHPDAPEGAHLGDSLGVLAGDLACAQAWALILRAPFPRRRTHEGLHAFVRMQQEVVLGQHLDLVRSGDVEAMHRLKTGSYTVRGPLVLGGLLAGATPPQLRALDAYAEPLGEAFQLRDDLLGTFGDAEATGKGTSSDLREGKRTALIAEAERSLPAEDLAALRRVLGRRDASEEELRSARALLGGEIRARVEGRLVRLHGEATAALVDAPLMEAGATLLRAFAERLALRDR